ncbi:transcription termination factor Rho, partial [Patescibacteria group bacterium]|nr:transcription termination factor Rho [Patescibacteria group bacterium]
MAYRASTKRSTPIKSGSTPTTKTGSITSKPEPASPKTPSLGGPVAEVPPTKDEELSVDALIGGPASTSSSLGGQNPVQPENVEKEQPAAVPASSHSVFSSPSFEPREQGYSRPLGFNRFSRGGGPASPYASQGGYSGQGPSSYNQGGPASRSASLGGYRSQRFGTPYRRPQRDFSQGENGGGPDITVPTETVKGILDIMPEGHGFLRPKFTPSDRDVYISQSQIRRFLLRNGDEVTGQARQPKDNERYWGLLKVEKINGIDAEGMTERPRFDDLIPIYPNVHLKLETGQLPLSTRIIDLLSPIGFGQRGLIVSPPKAGKTTILKEIATGISANYPNVHLMAALIGERPEEVTDLTRNIKGEVLSSNFDQSPQEQVRVAEVALDRAKRLVEIGKDVVILLDSVTRLARAYNLVVNPSGRTLSGGFDPAALYPAKKFLGAARCIEGTTESGECPSIGSELLKTNGSLTVIGTCLIDT